MTTKYLKELTHNIYDCNAGFTHSISIIREGDKVEGKRVAYDTIARLNIYAATTSYYPDLPELFSMSPILANTAIKSDKRQDTFIDYNSI